MRAGKNQAIVQAGRSSTCQLSRIGGAGCKRRAYHRKCFFHREPTDWPRWTPVPPRFPITDSRVCRRPATTVEMGERKLGTRACSDRFSFLSDSIARSTHAHVIATVRVGRSPSKLTADFTRGQGLATRRAPSSCGSVTYSLERGDFMAVYTMPQTQRAFATRLAASGFALTTASPRAAQDLFESGLRVKDAQAETTAINHDEQPLSQE